MEQVELSVFPSALLKQEILHSVKINLKGRFGKRAINLRYCRRDEKVTFTRPF